MRVLVCGDRNWTNSEVIRERLAKLLAHDDIFTLIHGAARGADSIAHTIFAAWAHEFPERIRILPYHANWGLYGKAAGPIRNQLMLVDGKPDLVLAFHNDIAISKGTRDMVRRAEKAGIPVEVITES